MSPVNLKIAFLTLSCCVFVTANAQTDTTTTPAATVQPPGETTQPASAEPYVGEVTGNNVYVRSGPSANYYPVAKVRAGQRVKIYEDKNGWLAIEPPAGCFSLIHKNFVDIGADATQGVVNGENVQVRAGSEIEAQLYAKQVKFGRGASVSILQPHNDDYLRIVPPPGALLYISGEFVARLSIPVSQMNEPAVAFTGLTDETPPAPTDSQQSPSDGKTEDATSKPKDKPGLHREEIAAIDKLFAAENEKPLFERDYSAVKTQYQKLSKQGDDKIAKAHADARLAQVDDAVESIQLVKQVRELSDSFASDRKSAMQQRDKIRPPSPEIGSGFDISGELRESMIYRGSSAAPQRYRIVGDDGSRTLGYVEIPDDVRIDIEKVLGRKVGVRARERRLQTEDVDPVAIFVAAEIVVLDAGPDAARGIQP